MWHCLYQAPNSLESHHLSHFCFSKSQLPLRKAVKGLIELCEIRELLNVVPFKQ